MSRICRVNDSKSALVLNPATSPHKSVNVSTMWFDGPLRLVDRICLSSMVDVGMRVRLYTFGDIPNVPLGISVEDGHSVLDPRLIDRMYFIAKENLQNCVPITQFSDFFRIFQQRRVGDLWLDTDMMLFRRFEYTPNTYIFAAESCSRMGYSVLHLPSSSPIVDEYVDLLNQNVLTPNWLGWRRGFLRPTIYRLLRKDFSPLDLGLTVFGNDALTRLSKRHGVNSHALPKESFYFWTGRKTLKTYRDVPWKFLLTHSKHIGLHIHYKVEDNFKPEPGSLWSWAIHRYG